MYLESINYKLGNSAKNICILFEENVDRLPNFYEDNILNTMKLIQKKIKDFSSFFNYFNLTNKSNEEILRDYQIAVGESKKKNYHGELDEILSLPSSSE